MFEANLVPVALLNLSNQLLYFSFFLFFCSFCFYCLALNTQESLSAKVITFYKNVSLISYSIMIGVYLLLVAELVYFTLNQASLHIDSHMYELTELGFQKFFSLILIYVCYVVGLISTTTLGERAWAQIPMAPAGMLYFPPVIAFLGNSSSILDVFMYYELILLPSVCLVHKTAYSMRSNQSAFYFFVWTQTGSIIAMLPVVYFYFLHTHLDFYSIKCLTLTNAEIYWIYLLFFLGFGVKVPVWPLHYWLIKVHVEAPSGFSIFLSGFLVKTGIFCFFICTSLLPKNDYFVFPVFLCTIGIVDSSLKLWAQEDIKKLIAYCTVQEMNIIYLMFNLGSSDLQLAGCFFVVAHSLLSSLMFFLVDCVYKRAGSRSISKTSGLSVRFPLLSTSIWVMLVSFMGFPGTAKFLAEVQLFAFSLEFDIFFGLFLLFLIIVVGSIGFAKNWFSIMYGQPQINSVETTAQINQKKEFKLTYALDLTKVEINVVALLSILTFAVNFSLFFCLIQIA